MPPGIKSGPVLPLQIKSLVGHIFEPENHIDYVHCLGEELTERGAWKKESEPMNGWQIMKSSSWMKGYWEKKGQTEGRE